MSNNISIRDYLNYVYPLARGSFALLSDLEINDFFNQLLFYYKLNPQPPATIPLGKYIPRNIKKLPKVGDLYSPAIINPDGFSCRNIYPDDVPLNNAFVNGFASNTDVEIWHTNVYNGSLGVYYYLTPGSGIYVNLGKTLVARNKLDALRKLGFSNTNIAKSLYAAKTAYWPAYYEGELPPEGTQTYFKYLVTDYMKQHNCNQTEAENTIIDAAINESNYSYGRVNDTGWQVDVDNFTVGKKLGYDTIQLTTQANMNNGWAFEIIDLRVLDNTPLDKNMAHLSQYYSIRNPFDLSTSKPLLNQWPYYNLYCEDTMSAIAQHYQLYRSRFGFPGPGEFSPTPVPGSPF